MQEGFHSPIFYDLWIENNIDMFLIPLFSLILLDSVKFNMATNPLISFTGLALWTIRKALYSFIFYH